MGRISSKESQNTVSKERGKEVKKGQTQGGRGWELRLRLPGSAGRGLKVWAQPAGG